MSELRELYQEVILDHNRTPRNFGALQGATHHAQGYNPLCGDRVQISLILDNDVIQEIHFEGAGCAISTASASLLTESLKGKTRQQATELFREFRGLVTGDPLKKVPVHRQLGKLAVFSGVCEFPVRVKCATLVWHTMSAALENHLEEVSTEES